MSNVLYYCTIILVWSTTPLAIKWSSSSLHFSTAISLRVILASIILVSLVRLFEGKLVQSRHDLPIFVAAGLGYFPNMLIVYWSTQYISSGLIAVIFGLVPILVGLYSFFLLQEKLLTRTNLLAVGVAVIGLIILNFDQISIGEQGYKGIFGMIIATNFFAVGSVLLKKIGANMSVLRQTAGAHTYALPFLLLANIFLGGQMPREIIEVIDAKSLYSVLYLVGAGSVLANILYFSVLKRNSPFSVSLITFVTPILAMILGVYADHEIVTHRMALGASLILSALAIYLNLPRRLYSKVCANSQKK